MTNPRAALTELKARYWACCATHRAFRLMRCARSFWIHASAEWSGSAGAIYPGRHAAGSPGPAHRAGGERCARHQEPQAERQGATGARRLALRRGARKRHRHGPLPHTGRTLALSAGAQAARADGPAGERNLAPARGGRGRPLPRSERGRCAHRPTAPGPARRAPFMDQRQTSGDKASRAADRRARTDDAGSDTSSTQRRPRRAMSPHSFCAAR